MVHCLFFYLAIASLKYQSKGDREGERGRGHSDSEVERRDIPYNTAPKTIKKSPKITTITKITKITKNYDCNLGLS